MSERRHAPASSAIRGIFVLLMPAVTMLAGCPQPAPPEAVLAGTWAVTVENAPDLKELLLTFDSNGTLQRIDYQVGANAVVTVPGPIGTTNVNGNDVSISASFNNNTLAFNGTLNDSKTVITGNLTTLISFGATVVTIDNGPATLTKQ